VSSPSIANRAEEPPGLDAPRFSLRQQILLGLISWAGYLAISLIAPTLRYSISWEEAPSIDGAIYEKPIIYSCVPLRLVLAKAGNRRDGKPQL
jgi:hypothetical protein